MAPVGDLQKEIRGRTVGYIGGAFGLVAGLAWNEAITTLINQLFPVAKDSLLIKFLYAIILTIVVVIVIKYIEKALNPSTPQS
jgi:uncharacterized BrkB/YihY/UPF0761 family membrane protein